MCACGCVCVCACACVLSQRQDAVDTFAFGLPWEQRPLPASPSRCEVPVSGLTDKPHLHAHYPVTVSPKFTLESCTWGARGIRRQGLWEVTRS